MNMASSWRDEEKATSSSVPVDIDSLLNDRQTNLESEASHSQEYTKSQSLGDEKSRNENPSISDVLQSSADASQQIGFSSDMKQIQLTQQQVKPKEKVTPETSQNKDVHERKSLRKRFKKRSYSPEPGASQPSKQTSTCKKIRRKKKCPKTTASAVTLNRPPNNLSNGKQFQCDLCKCSYICNPLFKKVSKLKKLKSIGASPRHKIDPVTEKKLTLCNACGLSFDRPRKTKKVTVVPSAEEKSKYFQESQTFASNLAVQMEDPNAERLWCPKFKSRPCGCLQEYLSADDDQEEMKQRAQHLLEILKKAKELSSQKCYNVNELPEAGKKIKRFRNIGLGNGQKRSKAFEDFVMVNRSRLRKELQLCERATQKILIYSNNFLHKKLKTEERECRVTHVKGKAALGLLPDLNNLSNMKCCGAMCVMMVLTHFKLLTKWRERAISGQKEARRVLAEMLTPSGESEAEEQQNRLVAFIKISQLFIFSYGGVHRNCYKFISWVTGCSHSTIGRVNEQMQKTGGDREPPVHGLTKYWKENPQLKTKPAGSTHNTSLMEEIEETLESPQPQQQQQQQQQQQPPPTTQQQQPHTLRTEIKVINTPPNSTVTTVTNVPVETLNQLLLERQLLQQQLLQQTLLQQLYQPESSQNPAVQQLLLKLLENNPVNQQNTILSSSESTPMYTNRFLRTQSLVSPPVSQTVTSATNTDAPATIVSLDQSVVTKQPSVSMQANIISKQPNKDQIGQQGHLIQNPTSDQPIVTMSSFLSSSPLAVQHSVSSQPQLRLPIPQGNEVSSVSVQTPINPQTEVVTNLPVGTNVMPLTQTETSVGLISVAVPPTTKPETTTEKMKTTTKVMTTLLHKTPVTKTLETVNVNLPVVATNSTGLIENWANVSIQVPQNQTHLSHIQKRTNTTPNILPINLFQRILNVNGVIATSDNSNNTTITVSVPTSNGKYARKKPTNVSSAFICNPILPTQISQDQTIQEPSLTPENYNILSTPHIKLAVSSSDAESSHPNTISVTGVSSNGPFLLPVETVSSKEAAKVTDVMIGDALPRYCNTVMLQTNGDIELLQLVPLPITQARSDDKSGQTGTITTLTTSHKSLLMSADQSSTTTSTTTITTPSITADLS